MMKGIFRQIKLSTVTHVNTAWQQAIHSQGSISYTPHCSSSQTYFFFFTIFLSVRGGNSKEKISPIYTSFTFSRLNLEKGHITKTSSAAWFGFARHAKSLDTFFSNSLLLSMHALTWVKCPCWQVWRGLGGQHATQVLCAVGHCAQTSLLRNSSGTRPFRLYTIQNEG